MQFPYSSENYSNTHPFQTLLTSIATKITLKQVLLIAIAFLAGLAFADLRAVPGLSMMFGSPKALQAAPAPLPCQSTPSVQSKPLTPTQRQYLQTLPQGTTKQALRSTLPSAYCQLPNLSLRAGTIAQRDVFQINASSWLIVMYEGDRFAGVREIK